MQRYKLKIEYDGLCFKGWQRQPHLPTVQETLEKAIFSFTHEEVEVYGAGRTDQGVHALGQIAHVDFKRSMTEHAMREAINFYLRHKGVIVLEVEKTSFDFHARFSARERGYLYKIIQRPSPLILEQNRAWQLSYPLDIAKMREAAFFLVGTQDFSSFRASECQAHSPIKTVKIIDIQEVFSCHQEIHIRIKAPSFLHHQVRNMVGALKMVGEGRWSLFDLQASLNAKNRRHGPVMAPAFGLYLENILY